MNSFNRHHFVSGAAFPKVALFLFIAIFATVGLFLTQFSTVQAASVSSLNSLRKQQQEEKAKADRAKQLKEKKEEQAREAQDQSEFLKGQVSELQKKEEETHGQISQSEEKISELSGSISTIEQKEAEQKRRTQEAARAFFKSRRKEFVDVQTGGELDILLGARISESSSRKNQFQAVAELLRERAVDLIETRNKLSREKSKKQDEVTQLTKLKSDQARLKRVKQETQTRYDNLASLSQTQAQQYHQEMLESLRKADVYEQKFREELTRIIEASKKGEIPRTGATVGQDVHAGEVIGHLGNTGYSTGPHLHFEVRLNNSAVNPRNYLGGQLRWPLESEYRITQEFGLTPYSQELYASGLHSGLDLAKYSGANIIAACTGKIYLDTYYGGYGRAFAHSCDGTDLVVLYGHMQAE